MSFERDTQRAAHPSGHSRPARTGAIGPDQLPGRTRLLITLLVVFIGIPAALFAWIGGVFLVDAWGFEMSSTQVLAWILAAITGVIVWPLALRRLRRELWSRQGGGASPAPTAGEAVVRSVIVVVGAIGIIALSGPLDIVSAVASAGASVAIGPRENGLLLQLIATVVILALAAPAFIVTQRALRSLPADDPRRLEMQERQNWHFAAATAWVVSLLVGYLLSLATLMTM
ncbi:MAG: hypothetical protein K0S70_980 [Microbacterium sp.]|jgi:hypothetical protein|uniref:hypothetical protein n=1 Tax=Microbacterium sp. Kw_RZR3 TaxID=3032903 RepID=UPI0023DCA895|nr:hypothetical protein [Microbacterium sp. Kw_RZR3]MDF2046945.1 hypothetical protein [Microbacterium sp. Kw_RZR3]MDF2916763.1 hypothetical protein [Microbacterium sp.]